MDLGRGQAAERVRDLFFRDLASIRNAHPDQHLCCIRTGRDRGAAALRFELRVLYAAVIDFDPKFHDVAADRIGNLGYGMSIGYFADTPWVLKVVQQFFRICHSLRFLVVRRQLSQPLDDARQDTHDVIDFFIRRHRAETETQAAMRFVRGFADRYENVRRLQRP